MSFSKLKLSVLAAVASVGLGFLGAGPSASAATLDLSAYGWYASFDQNISLTILSTSSSSIVVSLEKFADFTAPANNGVFQPMNIVFRQTSTSAVPKIVIEDETILNDTGSTWGGFRFLLEGGVGGNKPTFDASSANVSVGPQFSTATLVSNQNLTVGGGSLQSGSFPKNLWTPGYDSGAITINADPFTSGSLAQTFVFKEQPILIPLPAAAWTSLSGLLGVGVLVGAKQARKMLA
jgi:hypothetical protein